MLATNIKMLLMNNQGSVTSNKILAASTKIVVTHWNPSIAAATAAGPQQPPQHPHTPSRLFEINEKNRTVPYHQQLRPGCGNNSCLGKTKTIADTKTNRKPNRKTARQTHKQANKQANKQSALCPTKCCCFLLFQLERHYVCMPCI